MVRIEDHGSIMLVRPMNDEAREWLRENTDGTWFGGALAVEPRYVDALCDGLAEAGFPVEVGTEHERAMIDLTFRYCLHQGIVGAA